ncbi:MAG: hypothetical protein L6R37_005904 [Teloschistes peruensis]|nr:MAG: hypothetical protein L6R37_005904 [Teloschistes peruensis]
MACIRISRTKRLLVIIAISFVFFVAEISVGFSTHSLALVADAFHYLSDLIGFIVALVALRMSEREDSPSYLSFGWQRTQLLGAFFNGVFLIALALSISLQAMERFIRMQEMEKPLWVLVMGCVGLTLNIISALFLHEHSHDHGSHGGHDAEKADRIKHGNDSSSSSIEIPNTAHPHHHNNHPQPVMSSGYDLGMLGVLLHVISDAINNIGIIAVALIIAYTHSPTRFYADPAISLAISAMILLSAYPLITSAGSILLQAAPLGLDLNALRDHLEQIDGVEAVHELHAWRLSQSKSVATAHLLTREGTTMEGWEKVAGEVGERFCAYGIHSVTLQPEIINNADKMSLEDKEMDEVSLNDGKVEKRKKGKVVEARRKCRISCGRVCEKLKCCG